MSQTDMDRMQCGVSPASVSGARQLSGVCILSKALLHQDLYETPATMLLFTSPPHTVCKDALLMDVA